VITNDAVYSYDNYWETWVKYPPGHKTELNDETWGNVTTLDIIKSTLNMYTCYVRDFDSEIISFPQPG